MDSLAKRMRDHVNVRGGPTMKNGAWNMMLEAADKMEAQEATIQKLKSEITRIAKISDRKERYEALTLCMLNDF